MIQRMRHGVISPVEAGKMPGRIVNIKTKRNTGNNKIRLDKLLRSTTPKILVKRRLGGIGDVLMTTPLLRALKELIPNCELTYATDLKYAQEALADIIKHNPYVDHLIANDEINEYQYDYSVDITSTGLSKERSGSIPPNRIDLFAEEVGISIDSNPVPIYELTTSEKNWGRDYIKKLKLSKTIIAIQTRSNDARRTWPSKHIKDLCKLLDKRDNVSVLLFDWGKTTKEWSNLGLENIHLIANETLNHTASIIHHCDLVVCPDSSMLHLAGALNKKIVTVFGPIPPESRINHYTNATAVVKRLTCHPCWYTPRCIKGNSQNLECLHKVNAQEVLIEIDKKLMEPMKVHKDIIYGKDISNKGQDNIILIKIVKAGLGDMLMTTPALAALKEKYPNKEIHVACEPKTWPVLDNNPNVDKLLNCNDKFNPRRYFMVIDISSPCARYETARVAANKQVQKTRVEIFAEAMKVRELIKKLTPEYYIKEEDLSWAKEFIKKTRKTTKPLIAVGLRSAEMYRNWPEEKYNELFDEISKEFEIIILDHSRQYSFTNVIDACGFDIQKAIAILSQCDGLITVDSGLLHFGAALDIPIIALFGPIDYKSRCKGYNKITVVQSDLKCIPCWRNAVMPCKETNFIKGYSKCMEAIPTKQITNIAISKLRRNK